MSQTIYSDPFISTGISDFFEDAPLFTAPPDIESTYFVGPTGATPGHQPGLLQSVEVCRAHRVIQSQPLIAVCDSSCCLLLVFLVTVSIRMSTCKV